MELMLGKEACERLVNARVTVVGLGAVGSYAVEGLARAGVGHLRLVDFDRVCPSNFNRQLYALHSTLGRPKCEVARERVLDINPDCRVESIHGFIDAQTVMDMVGESPDVVVDAIDALGPKVELLAAMRTREISLISSMGAAMRVDATKIRVAPLEDVFNCPLAATVRRRLRRRDIPVDFPCVFSEEQMPHKLPIAAPTDPLGEQPIMQRGRVRNTMGSMPTITGIFGLTAANAAIRLLVERTED